MHFLKGYKKKAISPVEPKNKDIHKSQYKYRSVNTIKPS
jgi:hypothetical protein